jgi:hypothetical protein
MKYSPKKKPIDLRSLLDKIVQWNWRAIRVVASRILLAAGTLSFLGILILALLPMLKGYYVDGVTEFGKRTRPDETDVTIIYNFNYMRRPVLQEIQKSFALIG